jgi:uncharacterized membrane protein YeiH
MSLTGQFQLPIQFELAAVFLFAITGALLAIEKRYDIVGVFVLALITAVGGALVRDVFFLLQGPPSVLRDPRYVYVVAVAATLCLVLGTHLTRFRIVFLLVDALGLGIYAVVGTQRGLESGLPAAPAAFVGLANAVGGSVLRDVLTAKETLLFRPGEFYVLAAAGGIAVFLALGTAARMDATNAAMMSIATTFLVRLAALSFNWKTAAARPLLRARPRRDVREPFPTVQRPAGGPRRPSS